MLDQLVLGRLGPGPQHHDGVDLLAPDVVGDADYRRLLHRRVLGQGHLHLGRENVLSAGDDHVLHPVHEEQVAAVVEVAGVAGAIPAVPEDLGGSLGLVPVLAHEVAGPGPDLPRRPPGNLVAVGVPDRQRDPGHSPARRLQPGAAQAVVPAAEEGQQRRGLGHPVALGDVEVGVQAQQPVQQGRGHGRGAVGQPLEGGQALGGEVGMAEHQGDHGRHHQGLGDGVALDQVDDRAGVEQRDEHRQPARGRDAQHPGHGGGVEHRGLVEVDGFLLQGDDHGHVVEVQHLGPAVDQHPLGQAGGAAGIHQHHRVGLLGLIGHHRIDRGQHVLVADVVGHVAVADEDHVADRARLGRGGQGVGEVLGEEGVDEHHLGAGVAHDVVQLGAG